MKKSRVEHMCHDVKFFLTMSTIVPQLRPLTRVSVHLRDADSTKQLQLSVITSKLKLLSAFRHFRLSAGEAVKRVSVHL